MDVLPGKGQPKANDFDFFAYNIKFYINNKTISVEKMSKKS